MASEVYDVYRLHIFFFIGAPLGAIIHKEDWSNADHHRRDSLHFYYIINTSGMKMARDGAWNMIFWYQFRLWCSPLGCFLTYKANNDSVVFNADVYAALFKHLAGLALETQHHAQRSDYRNAMNYAALLEEIDELEQICKAYAGP